MYENPLSSLTLKLDFGVACLRGPGWKLTKIKVTVSPKTD